MIKAEKQAFAKEISRLLAMTKTFSDAFDIRYERVRNWRLVGLLMEISNGDHVVPYKFREAIQELVKDEGGSIHALYQWQYRYAYEFKNPAGWFLEELPHQKPPAPPQPARKQKKKNERRTRRPNIKAYRLNELFRDCEHAYVSRFLELFSDDLGDVFAIGKDDPRLREVFKLIVKFQRTHYLPLWRQVSSEIRELASGLGYDTTGLTSWGWKAPLWVLVLACWQEKLKDPKKWFQASDVNRYAVQALADGNLVDECLDMLSDEKGCKFLIRKKVGFEQVFIFNKKYDAALINYSRPLPALWLTLRGQILDVLRTTG
jgi:hypothetical protein